MLQTQKLKLGEAEEAAQHQTNVWLKRWFMSSPLLLVKSAVAKKEPPSETAKLINVFN